MPKHPERHLVIAIEDRASAFLRSVPDLMPDQGGVDVPSLPADLIHVSASRGSDDSVRIALRPSVAALRWAARAAAESYPPHLRSVKVALPE